jgi:hypothetical protein
MGAIKMRYASRKEIRKAIQTLREPGTTAEFSAARCAFRIPKSTAISILKERIDIAKEGPETDHPWFNVTILYPDWQDAHVCIYAGSEDG